MNYEFFSKLDELSAWRRKIIRSLNTSPLNLTINATQEQVLMAILISPETNMTDLSIQMGLDKSTLTRVVDSLINEGLVFRTYRNQDRRIINCSLTEKGKEVANTIDHLMKNHLEEIFSNLSEAEVSDLEDCLDKSVSLLEKAIEEKRVKF